MMVCPSGLISTLIHEPSFVLKLIFRAGFSGSSLYSSYFTESFWVVSETGSLGSKFLGHALAEVSINTGKMSNESLPIVSQLKYLIEGFSLKEEIIEFNL